MIKKAQTERERDGTNEEEIIAVNCMQHVNKT